MKVQSTYYLIAIAAIVISACSDKQQQIKSEFPTKQVNSIAISTVTDSSANVVIAKGDGENRIIVISERDSIAAPANGKYYLPGSMYADSNRVSDTDCYVVYNSGVHNNPREITIAGLKPNTKYTIKGFEYNGKDSAAKYLTIDAASNPRTFTTLLIAPKDLKTTRTTNDGFECKWTADAGVKYYEFDLATDEDFNNYVGIYHSADIGAEGIYELVELSKGTYYYRIRAVAGNQKSAYSAVQTAKIGGK